jgi:16S rRNA (guanine966-N2)-methyltransferase
MRIVGGELKGRGLVGPSSAAIRPTSDRLRETIFDILAHGYGDPVTGARVLDLFAGSGAMAIEAVSRGARYALMVDTSAEALALGRANRDKLGLSDRAGLLRRDATRIGARPAGEPFDLAFLDPPYGKGLVGPALGSLRDGHWLASGALVVVEEAKGAEIVLPGGFGRIEARTRADTQVVFLRAE